ncbi:unnamed protein product [Prorocentrum cordatum]|uniref:Reverse transcriptase domain-containing protein n=1 Tax=Prorocentrum cordatum TaxID=2364126 RepID=A0ABN9W005_9DINO|nr:unnamed protein product [Polarella glacialis]
MAQALRARWSDVFGARRCDAALLSRWLAEELPPPPPHEPHESMPQEADPRWQLRWSDVEDALRQAPPSAPGPDGVTFLAWQRLGGLAVDILLAAALDMAAPGGPDRIEELHVDWLFPGQSFNSSAMVFLPKSPTGQAAIVGDYCAPSDTRPLNISNCENRLPANAVRLRVEPLLAEWVSDMQQGFLVGRSLFSNVVAVDHDMMRCALQEEAGAAIFFEFRAAFPSVAHDFLRCVLSHLRLPGWFLHFFEALYKDNKCELVVAGSRHPGFALKAGIRQGCPLSPLIFAVAADILLRRLRRLSLGSLRRAYADDLAGVVPDYLRELPRLAVVFTEYAAMSGLQLNISKTILVPLFLADNAVVQNDVSSACPGWAGIRISSFAKYLGFYLGPGCGNRAYDAPLRKYSERAQSWGAVGAGLFYTLAAYSVCVLPVLTFVAQLDRPPPSRVEAEIAAVRRLTPGPGHWCCPLDLRCLEFLGFPKSLPDFEARVAASQCRVAHLEAVSQGGVQIASRARELREWRHQRDSPIRAATWASWLDRAFVFQLEASVAAADRAGASRARAEFHLSERSPRPFTMTVDNRVRRGSQRFVCRAVEPDRAAYMVGRMGERLQRRSLPASLQRRGERAASMLQHLAPLVPPRVWASVLRTLWNGWVTARRWPGGPMAGSSCIFGCRHAMDSIEHYASCDAVADFARRRLGIPRAPSPEAGLAQLLLLDRAADQRPQQELTLWALRTAAVYKVHNWWRHATRRTPRMARDALQQAVRDLVSGHAGATRTLDAARR